MPTLNAPAGFGGEFHTDHSARSAYSEGAGPYRIVPAAVAIPRHVDDLTRLVHMACDQGVSLVPRGAGSGMPGGNVGSGIVVDLQRFRRPLRISTDKYAYVGAAVTWADLNQAARRLSLRLPPDPASGSFCTIGGMTATNAAGARSVRYGSMRRWVSGVELLTVDGEVGWLSRAGRTGRRVKRGQRRRIGERLAVEDRFDRDARPVLQDHQTLIAERFPTTTKNSSGYALDEFLKSDDLVDLIVGSEGTLGFITRVEVELDHQPAASAAVLLALKDLATLGDVVRSLLSLDPSAVELLDRTFLDVAQIPDRPLQGVDALLLVEFERPEQAAARGVAGDAVRRTAPWCVYVETALADEDRANLWRLRHAASSRLAQLPPTRRSLQIIEDGCVPIDVLGRYISRVRQAAQDAAIEIVAFGHAGDGHLHVNALVDTTQADFPQRLSTLLETVTEVVAELGGTTSGEHGDGRLRTPLLARTYGPEVTALFKLVKDTFDPSGILNPGVIVGAGEPDPVAHLKVGPGAASIPEHIDRGLLAMERRGGWAIPKLDLCREDAASTLPAKP